MAQDNTLAIVAIIISLIAVIAAGASFLVQPEIPQQDLSPLYDSTNANDLAINQLNIDLAKVPSQISNAKADLIDYINIRTSNKLDITYDDNDFEDFERAIDKNNDDINDLEDEIANCSCIDGIDGEDCDTVWIDSVQDCFNKSTRPQMINCLFNL